MWGKVGYLRDVGSGWRSSSHSSTRIRTFLPVPFVTTRQRPPTTPITMAFRGTYDYTLDSKNRLTVPAKFRAELAGGGVLAKGFDGCVALWTPDAYEASIAATAKDFHPGSVEARKLRRWFAANSQDVELDAAGRVGIPTFLLEHAGLQKDVVVTGAEDCMEIWDRDAWAAYNTELGPDIDDITALLGGGPRETGA